MPSVILGLRGSDLYRKIEGYFVASVLLAMHETRTVGKGWPSEIDDEEMMVSSDVEARVVVITLVEYEVC